MVEINVTNINNGAAVETQIDGDRDTIMTDLTLGVSEILEKIAKDFPETDYLTNVNVLKESLLYVYLCKKAGITD